MNPAIAYVCFNRMGSTVLSLLSLLRTKDDFDLYIGDNDSRDKTWDFLMSLNDPRIKGRKKFEHNWGEINVINWALSKRKSGQDFIVMENDCRLHDEEFVTHFDRAFAEIPKLGAASGWLRSIKVDSAKVQGYFYPDTVMGQFTCFKGAVMDQLGYYSEACYIADVEINYRIRNILGFSSGYIKLIDCSLLHPWGFYSCADCKTHQNVCDRCDILVVLSGETRPVDLARDLYCNRFYPTLNREFWKIFGEEGKRTMLAAIQEGRQVYWDSVHSGNPLPAWQEEKRKKFQEFFEHQYREYLLGNKLVNGEG